MSARPPIPSLHTTTVVSFSPVSAQVGLPRDCYF